MPQRLQLQILQQHTLLLLTVYILNCNNKTFYILTVILRVNIHLKLNIQTL